VTSAPGAGRSCASRSRFDARELLLQHRERALFGSLEAYRDAEIALYDRLFAARFSAAVVGEDLRATLADQQRRRLEAIEREDPP
jgi:hypothetical protein